MVCRGLLLRKVVLNIRGSTEQGLKARMLEPGSPNGMISCRVGQPCRLGPAGRPGQAPELLCASVYAWVEWG